MSEPATQHGTPQRPPNAWRLWRSHHRYAMTSCLQRIAQRPWSVALTVTVMAIALLLPLALKLVQTNASRLTGNIQQSRQIDVYLQTHINDTSAQQMRAALTARADVASVDWLSPEQGLHALREQGHFAEAIALLDADDNPLPHLLIVTPQHHADDAALVQALQQLDGVDAVYDDNLWRQRLQGWLALSQRLGWVLALLLGLAAMLIAGNTVRMDIQSRRKEITVLQQLGADNGFIRRPFLYLGACYGMVAGLMALGFLFLLGRSIRAPLAALAHSYGSNFSLQGFDLPQIALILLLSSFLGWLGAGMVTGHFLRQTQPGG